MSSSLSLSDLSKVQESLSHLGPEGRDVVSRGRQISDRAHRMKFYIAHGKRLSARIKYLMKFVSEPVSIKEFVESPQYLNQNDVLYPKVLEELIEANSGKYVEGVFTGGIGTGKTTLALFTTAYQLYILSLMKDPHREFGIAPSDEIVFIFQSITSALAKAVDYTRFRSMISGSPYFMSKFPFNKSIESELRFPRHIVVKPVSGSDTGAIGQNVFGGVLDEVNFMAVVSDSKQSKDGGEYNQAWQNYRAIVRRRESRFMKLGELPGMLCLVSSKQYPGEFTDVKAEEARRETQLRGSTKIYVYDRRVWEIKPEGSFSEDRFHVFLGDETRKPRILDDGEAVDPDDRSLVLPVPEEYRISFEQDLLAALRDIGGMSTLALHPFILDVEKVSSAFGKCQSILSTDQCDLEYKKVAIYPKRIKHKQFPRFVHIDLALSGDSAGIACGYVDKFIQIRRGDNEFEVMPNIVYDFVLEVTPPKGGEISIAKIRSLIYKLREQECPIKWITMDSFQSADSLQILTQQGFMTGKQSVDITSHPYDVLKTALYDDRVSAPVCPKARQEIVTLERDPKKNVIDHPPNGSKDVADGMAGVAYGLTMRNEIWVQHGVVGKIPMSVKSKAPTATSKKNISYQEYKAINK